MAITGEQFEIRRGAFRAVVTELAAALRVLQHDGTDLVEHWDADGLPPAGAGIVLAPWPNRVRDAVWSQPDVAGGATQKLDVTELSTGNASHGLLRNTGYRLAERTESSIVLVASVFPQHGWPFRLDTTVEYALVDDGLRVTHSVRNASGARAPFAVGAHPYFRIGDRSVGELVLTIAAGTRIETDAQSIPVATHPVTGSEFDLREGRLVADLDLDTAFGEVRTVDGASAWLTAPDGARLALLQDDDFGYVQAYTPHALTVFAARQAVALEPMTAPANALNSGEGLRWLDPGAEWSGSWGVRFTPAP